MCSALCYFSAQLKEFDSFFKQEGQLSLIFFYQPPSPPPESAESATPKSTPYNAHGRKLWITDGTTDQYTGSCLFFVRLNPNKAITMMNIHQELYFGSLESNGDGLLGAVEKLLGSVFVPALTSCEKWGNLTGPEGQVVKNAFLGKLSGFVAVLANARASIANAVKLSPCKNEALSALSSPSDILAAAGNPELVEAAEMCVQQWYSEIEQILTESEQMRKESDDVGPRAELEHWKKRMAKFDSLTTCVKSPQCRAVINVLVAAKSKLLKVRIIRQYSCFKVESIRYLISFFQSWKEQDMTITDFTNEAKDNVKFLYTLEKYCEPLYNCNPVRIITAR